jgi:cytochrome c oxidase subunit 1
MGGLGNIFVPILIGSTEVGYPRVNNMSLLLLPISYGLLMLSLIDEFGIGMGWTLYPPLSTSLMNLSSQSIDLIIYGITVSGISSSLTSINIFGTLMTMK